MSDVAELPLTSIARSDARRARHPHLHVPFAVRVSPHADAVERASVEWAAACGLVTGAEGVRRLAAARTGRLAALGFPSLGREALQIAADWTTAFCLLDDHTEEAAGSPLRL